LTSEKSKKIGGKGFSKIYGDLEKLHPDRFC
jgi:hypothetical protein